MEEVRQGINKPNRLYINGSVKITHRECKKYTSGSVKNTLQEVQKLHGINTNIINTNIINTNISKTTTTNTSEQNSLEKTPTDTNIYDYYQYTTPKDITLYYLPFKITPRPGVRA